MYFFNPFLVQPIVLEVVKLYALSLCVQEKSHILLLYIKLSMCISICRVRPLGHLEWVPTGWSKCH